MIVEKVRLPLSPVVRNRLKYSRFERKSDPPKLFSFDALRCPAMTEAIDSIIRRLPKLSRKVLSVPQVDLVRSDNLGSTLRATPDVGLAGRYCTFGKIALGNALLIGLRSFVLRAVIMYSHKSINIASIYRPYI
jgi:hypothetical protein